jgi:UDP-N-acetylglucosamine acyltransferase
MTSLIADSARVDSRARLAGDSVVGPGCVIGPDVEIGRGTRLVGNVSLMGVVRLGDFNTVGPFVTIGGEPQDLSYWGSATRVEIGDYNRIDERVTIHRGSEKDDGVTRLGSHNHLLAGSHVAHDCKLGDRISVGSLAMLGGHVHVGSAVNIGEKAGVHQFVTVGRLSSISGQSKIVQDVPCFMRVGGNPSSVHGINGRRLKREGFSAADRAALRAVHRLIYFGKLNLRQAAEVLEVQRLLTTTVVQLLTFVDAQHHGRLGRARERRRET